MGPFKHIVLCDDQNFQIADMIEIMISHMVLKALKINNFLAHLWCAYAMALCLSWIVRREVGCVCVEHNYPKMWMD